MYISLRHSKLKPGEAGEVARRINADLLPLMRTIRGYRAYYVFHTAADEVAAVSMYEDEAGVKESDRVAVEWVRANLSDLIFHGPEVVDGVVIVSDENVGGAPIYGSEAG